MTLIHFVFDSPPGPEGARFVECETPDGRSVNIGEWHRRTDGLWEVRVRVDDTPEGHVKVPTSSAEARMMRLLADDYLSQSALLAQAGVAL